MRENDSQDWLQYKMMVMDRLEKLEHQQKDFTIETRALTDEMHNIQFEAATWGAIAGLVPVVIIVVIGYLKFHNLLKCEKE